MHLPARTTRRHPTRSRAVLVASVTLALTMGHLGTAGAQQAPSNRGIADACVDAAMEADHFDDVRLGTTHSAAIDCLWVYGVVQGRFVDRQLVYEPGDAVSRQQMASFITRLLQRLPDRYYTLPEVDDEPRFDDASDISDAHVFSVNVLHEAGIAEGFADGTYGPTDEVDRAQMASFIARAIEEVLQDELPHAEGTFGDIAGNEHEANIEKLATAGIVQGSDGNYRPGTSTTRAQMASFIARAMDYLVATGVLIPLQFAQGTATTYELIDVAVGQQNGAERVTFTLDGDEGTAGWRMAYVDAATQDGSGMQLDVAGDAIIEVVLTGTAPPDLDLEFATGFGGDAIVEIVDGGWFEGRHQLFIGTTGLFDLDAAQLDGPRRVYLDILTE